MINFTGEVESQDTQEEYNCKELTKLIPKFRQSIRSSVELCSVYKTGIC